MDTIIPTVSTKLLPLVKPVPHNVLSLFRLAVKHSDEKSKTTFVPVLRNHFSIIFQQQNLDGLPVKEVVFLLSDDEIDATEDFIFTKLRDYCSYTNPSQSELNELWQCIRLHGLSPNLASIYLDNGCVDFQILRAAMLEKISVMENKSVPLKKARESKEAREKEKREKEKKEKEKRFGIFNRSRKSGSLRFISDQICIAKGAFSVACSAQIDQTNTAQIKFKIKKGSKIIFGVKPTSSSMNSTCVYDGWNNGENHLVKKGASIESIGIQSPMFNLWYKSKIHLYDNVGNDDIITIEVDRPKNRIACSKNEERFGHPFLHHKRNGLSLFVAVNFLAKLPLVLWNS